MALNRETFKTRTLTSLIFMIIMAAGVLTNHWTFFLLFSIIHFGCWFEYQKLVGLIDKEYQEITPFHRYGIMLAGWCIMLYFTNDAFHIFDLRLQELGWWAGLIFVFILPINEVLFARQIQLKNIGHSLFGLIYISLSLGLMVDLYNYPLSIFENQIPPASSIHEIDLRWSLPILLVASLWINDTMAYLLGSFIGKTSLSKISPKKTWEGTIGGMVFTLFLAGLLAWWLDLNIVKVLLTAGIAVIAGTFGDLLESRLKRMAGVKDSGRIMPGHGGFLDRFDSLLLATPFVWLFVVVVLRPA